MKDLTPKFDDTAGATGQLTADEFNDFADDVQNSITESGQTLTAGVGDNNRQLLMAIAARGKRISRSDTETALIGEVIVPNNLATSLTIILPPTANLFIGATVFFEQEVDQLYSAFSLTLGRNSNSIMGDPTDLVLNSVLSDDTLIAMVWVGGSIDVAAGQAHGDYVGTLTVDVAY